MDEIIKNEIIQFPKFDLRDYDRFLMRNNRKLVISGEIREDTSFCIIQDVYYLLSLNSREPVELILSSPGGNAEAGFAGKAWGHTATGSAEAARRQSKEYHSRAGQIAISWR